MKKIIFLLVLTMMVSNIVSAEKNTYVSEEYKVSLKAPEGWHLARMKKGRGTQIELVKFSQYPPSSPQFPEEPQISLTIKEQPKQIKNFDEYLERYLKKSKSFFKHLEPPKDVLINGNRGVRFEKELAFAGMTGGRLIEYIFWKNNLIYFLGLNVTEKGMDEIDKYIDTFDVCANTLLIE